MNLKNKKYFFSVLFFACALVFGYRLGVLAHDDFKSVNYTIDISILITFLLLTLGSLYEWISIRKKLNEF